MIHVMVRERDAEAQATEPITSGSVGLEVGFRFSEDWDGMGKAVIFKGSGTAVDAALSGSSCTVPHEVLALAGGHLKIGVYGTKNEGQVVTPTIWADAGPVLEGAEPSELDTTPATESLVQQLLEAAEAAQTLAQSVRDDADAGEFDGAKGDKGDKGDRGEAGSSGAGVASGGSEGQYLRKKSGADYDTEWTGEPLTRLDAELAALCPKKRKSGFTWNLGHQINSSGGYAANDLWACTVKKQGSPGAVVQNLSAARDANNKSFYLHLNEYSGDTWLRRNTINSGAYRALGSDADGYRLNFGYGSGQSAPNMDAATLETYFGVRIVDKPGAADVGAIAAPAGPGSGDFLCWNGSAWAATTLAAWQGGSY